jgi:GAF domain-containing protein
MIAQRLMHELAAVIDLSRAGCGTEVVYNRVIEAASKSITGCDGASFVLWHGNTRFVHLATHPDLAQVDEAQFQMQEGPAITALHEAGAPVMVTDCLHDARWPAYSTVAVHHGVRSCYATAFDLPHGWGVLQLHASAPGRLPPGIEDHVALVVSQTRTAVRNALAYGEARARAEQMRAARESSAVIEEAKGILMHAYGCDADAAFDRLRTLSQQGQVKLVTVARKLVEQVAAGKGGHTVPA